MDDVSIRNKTAWREIFLQTLTAERGFKLIIIIFQEFGYKFSGFCLAFVLKLTRL